MALNLSASRPHGETPRVESRGSVHFRSLCSFQAQNDVLAAALMATRVIWFGDENTFAV